MSSMPIDQTVIHSARPRYRKKHASHSSELTVGGSHVRDEGIGSPGMLMPSIGPSRSVKRTIQEVKMVQVCVNCNMGTSLLWR